MSEEVSGEQPAGEEPLAPVETSEATTEQPATETAETDQAEPDTGDDEAAKPRKKPGVHNRIDELTRQKHEALREAEYWRKKAEEARATDLDALDYDDQLVAKVRRAEREERAETAQEAAQKAVLQQFTELENEARAKWVDYDAVTRNPNVPITPAMAEIIRDSEYGPDIAYHFGKNPAEAARYVGMSGVQLARELGRLEAQLTAPKPVPKVPAAPIRPVTGSLAGGKKDPAAMSMDEYVAARGKGLI
jgi:hypothetical protein